MCNCRNYHQMPLLSVTISSHHALGPLTLCSPVTPYVFNLKYSPMEIWCETLWRKVQNSDSKPINFIQQTAIASDFWQRVLRWINTLRPRQNGQHFPEDIFKLIFFNENIRIFIKISLKFVPKGPINNVRSLVQIMAWRHPGDKTLSEPMMVWLLMHICVARPQWVDTLRPQQNSCLEMPSCVKRPGSTLVQVMACCLMAPSHSLNQCSLLTSQAVWHQLKTNFPISAEDITL